ncbi:MAG: HAD hydrolase-like protein [Pseudomonadales bacterium]
MTRDLAADHWHARVRDAEAVLFDFDGTLAPNLNLPDLRGRVAALTRARGVPEAAFAGHYIVEILDAGAAWLDDAAAATALKRDGQRLIRDYEIEAARSTEPFDDARRALAALRAHGKSLGVITRNCRAAVLAAFPDLEDCCDGVLARDDVVHLKPDVRHLIQALEHLRAEPSRTLMVGDGQLDMRLGRARGLYCVGVLTGSSDESGLREAGADVVLPRAGDLALALPVSVGD